MNILLIGNCQMLSYAAILSSAGYKSLDVIRFNEVTADHLKWEKLREYNLVIAHDTYVSRPMVYGALKDHPQVMTLPVLFFDGFTPDDEVGVTFSDGSGALLSKIAVGGFRNGLSKQETVELYNPQFCDLMGYTATFERSKTNFIKRLSGKVSRPATLFEKWYGGGPFFHTSNHPHIFVAEDILRDAVNESSHLNLQENISYFCEDPLKSFAISPQLNHPQATNLITSGSHQRKHGSQIVQCADFVAYCYETLEKHRGKTNFRESSDTRFDSALKANARGKLEIAARNPYKDKPSISFWGRTVARPNKKDVTPIGNTAPIIFKDTKVATAGSCFAQHVARAMISDGLNYFVAENAPQGLSDEVARERTYGLFSARYGNIYSSRQLVQLVKRAYSTFAPVEISWPVNGGYVDPFRPNIGEIFPSSADVVEARSEHLSRVREMFENLDVFVFTMGLTEGWVDRRDGSAYPVAPAAVSDKIDPDNYKFLNSGYHSIRSDMIEFIDLLKRVNPKSKVVLTVSPVPLIATFTETDVLSATTYSKAVLRSVAGDLSEEFSDVFYFPSFEIITGAFNRGEYFENDLRSVRPEGVDHVMRVFREVLVGRDGDRVFKETEDDLVEDLEYERQLEVVCDEEMLLR